MKNIKKIAVRVIAFLLLFIVTGAETGIVYAENEASKPQLLSDSFVLMESSTGTVIYERDMHQVLPPASITKVMTLLLIYEALEEGSLTKDTIVTVTDHAASMGGSQVYLEPGEQQTVETLIKCICISSANDACVAMAEHISGTEEAFVDEMNQKAKELGMNDTHFVNCCGLDVDGHVSSAYDIAIMSRALMSRYPDVMTYTTTRLDSMTHITKNGSSEFGLTNTNKLLQQYEGITGLKTGSTSKAKYCLTATATRNGIDMIAVVLAAPDTKTRFKEAATLLNYGFSQCKVYRDDQREMPPVLVPVEHSMDLQASLVAKEEFIYVTVTKEDLSSISKEVLVYESIQAPIEAGEELGMLIYYLEGNEIGRIPLVAQESVAKATYQDYLKKILNLLT